MITAGISGPLAKVRMPIVLSAGNLRISVNNTIAAAPGNTILASVVVAAGDLPGSFPMGVVFSSIVFDTPAFFSAGDQFSIVLECEGSPGSCQGAYVQGPVGNPYPGGNGWFDSRPNQPGVWVPIGGIRFDLPFQTFVLGSTAGPAMGEMPTVALAPGVHTITLTVDDGNGGTDSDTVEVTVNEASVDEGHMTGGGSFFDGSFTRQEGRTGTRFTHGFTLSCQGGPNNLQVDWKPPGATGSFRFHLEELQEITCIDDPELDEGHPVAGFDTVVGKGLGRLNGESGATIEFTFTDDGEPGQFADIADVVITSVAGVVYASRGALQNGNQQAHGQN